MDVVHPRVAGIDVHKKIIWVAVRLPGPAAGQRTVTVRRVATFWRSLQKMAAWLAELGVTDTAMESTGVYWWPVHHALAQAGIGVCVCHAAHMRNVPGRKTGLNDCQWIAELHEYGLLRPSFIPAAEVAALRQRTRYRKKLIEQRYSELQRLAKVLEDAGIKTGLGGFQPDDGIGAGHGRGAGRRRTRPGRASPAGPPGDAQEDPRAADGLRRPVHSDHTDADADYYDRRDQRNHQHLVRHHEQALARLGYRVTLIPPGDGSPPRPRPPNQHPTSPANGQAAPPALPRAG